MSDHVPNLVLNLSELSKPLDYQSLFGRTAPVEFEIGIGSGYFLSRYASEHPELNLFGMDKFNSEVMRTQDKCRRFGAHNVRLLRCDAIYFLEDYPPDESVQAFHVYYSDPWPKTRHHKRRLWRSEFVRQMHRVLQPNGKVFLKTDVTDYYKVIQKVMNDDGLFNLVEDKRIDEEPIDGDYQTNFQRKAIEQGHPLHYQVWEKQAVHHNS